MCLVPKGTNVLVQSFTNHRREDLWGADASEWKPERWKVRRQSPAPKAQDLRSVMITSKRSDGGRTRARRGGEGV